MLFFTFMRGVNPLNHLSSSSKPCSVTFVKKRSCLLIPFAGTNGQDLCLDMTVTAALKVVTCKFSLGIKGF